MNNRNKALLVFLIAFTGVILMMAWILKEPSVLSLVTSAICIPLLLWFAAINLRIIAMHQQKGKVSAVFLPTDRVSIIGKDIDGNLKSYHRPVAIMNGSMNIYVVCDRKIKRGDYAMCDHPNGKRIIRCSGEEYFADPHYLNGENLAKGTSHRPIVYTNDEDLIHVNGVERIHPFWIRFFIHEHNAKKNEVH